MKKFLPFLLIAAIGILIWSPILNIFYLQDEWQGIGHLLIEGWKHPFIGSNFIQFIFGETRPLSRVLGMYFFGQNVLNSVPIAVFSLGLHIVNSYLVYLLSKKVVKSEVVNIISGITFLVSSVSSNAVFWFSTSIGTLPATTLIIISLFKFFDYVEKGKMRSLWQSFIILYISTLFKEIGVFLFLFLPLAYIFIKNLNVVKVIKTFWPFVFFFFVTTVFKIHSLYSFQGTEALFLTGSSNNFYLTLVLRSILYPITSFSLQFVPVSAAIDWARGLTQTYYPWVSEQNFVVIAETVVLDVVAIILSVTFIGIFLLAFRKASSQTKKYLCFFLGFSIFSFLPYIIISKTFSYLESRYYYLSMVAASVIFSWFVQTGWGSKKILIKMLAMLFVTIFIYAHSIELYGYLKENEKIGLERKIFIEKLLEFKPNLEKDKNVFFINLGSDYYIPGNRVPFQHGIGYSLMVWYFGSGKIPSSLLRDNFLWDIGSQGYWEEGPKGFGYFSDPKLLENTVRKYDIPRDSIYIFSQ